MEEILSGVKNIYLVGIGGIGMTGLALLLKDKGFSVKGSDIQDSHNTKILKEEGIEVFIGHRRENVAPDTHLVGYSSAIKEDNPEILEAKKRGITILKRGELLGLLSWDKKTLAVAGSHGKTTTTSLLGFLLSSLGYKPTVFVGGLPLGRERNAWWGEGYFVIETDESDASFLYYNPWVSIITNIDYEHLDHYKDIENLKKGFLQFAYQTKDLVIGCGDDPFVKEVLHKTGGLSYGFGVDNKIKGANFFFDGESTCFDLIIDNKIIKQVKILLLGQHNILNTLAVLSFLFYLGQDLEKATPLLRDFKGTKRRFQIKKKVGGITFVDDYAHHPTEIAAVLGAAHTLNYKRVFVIVQPHRFSRVQALHKEFSQCFSFADELVVTDIYSASEREINGISGKFLFEEIKKNFSGNIRYIPKDKLIQEIPYSLKEGDLVLGLGAGDINTLMERIANEFEKNRVEA